MKLKIQTGSFLLIAGTLSLTACEKNYSTETNGSVSQPVNAGTVRDSITSSTLNQPYPQQAAAVTCDYAPSYGDSIVYPQPNGGQDYYVNPVNNGGVDGTYLAWPEGLSLNSKTGAIDLTKSETGARYDIAFVRSGTTDTCMSRLIVGGAAYMDSIYVLTESDTSSRPYFDANYFQTSPCNGSSGGKGCQFDYNNVAKSQGIEIDQHTGYIDLKKTMKHSIFGLLPVNGMSIYTTIYYKLNDASNGASQSIQLQLTYYNKKSDIPVSLTGQVFNLVNKTLTGDLLSQGKTTRPPLIIITRAN